MLTAAQSTSATQFHEFDRRSQVAASDAIIVGRAIEASPHWDDDGSIVTDTLVAIDEAWKGLPDADQIVVRTLGGTVGDTVLAVEGSPRIEPGERLVLFLTALGGDVYRPSGMAFGKYTIEGCGANAFVVGDLPPAVSAAQEFPAVSIGLDDLRREVRSLVAGDGP